MRLGLGESVPKALGYLLEPHFVRTAQNAGFTGLLKGALLAAMQTAGFDALITFDQNLPYPQNTNLPVFVVVLKAKNNRVETALRFAPLLLSLLKDVPSKRLTVVTLEAQ